MFGLFRKNPIEIVAPCGGELLSLSSLSDPVFAQGMAGEGVALRPVEETFCAPIAGKVSKIFPTRHAFIVSNEKLSVTVHIGIDTVALQGEGFESLIEEGAEVAQGDAIIRADLRFIASQGKAIETPVLIAPLKGCASLHVEKGVVKRGEKIAECR